MLHTEQLYSTTSTFTRTVSPTCIHSPVTSAIQNIQLLSLSVEKHNSWSTFWPVSTTTSGGHHWLGVHVLDHEEENKRGEEYSTKQVKDQLKSASSSLKLV